MSTQVDDLTRTLAKVTVQDPTVVSGEDVDEEEIEGIEFVDYTDESQLEYVMDLVSRDLSEPYSSECFPEEASDGLE